MKGYKAMNEDMTCRGFQYEIGKTYEIDDDAKICERGFHFCQDIKSVFHYYKRFESRVFEIEANGYIKQLGDKFCCPKITILRELKGAELNRAIYGSGFGDGNGDGRGNGNSYGNGYGNGCGTGYGYGNGYGYGYGDSTIYSDRYSSGYGCGNLINIQKILEFMED